jgi:phosphoribosylglycinamide formyltransferase 1
MSTFRIVVLISGGGTTLRNLLKRKADGALEAEIVHVIASRADARGLAFAYECQIPVTVIDPREVNGLEEFSHAIFDVCRSVQADLVVMGGFLKRVLIPADFENRVINIHPSLIPAFCGQGMYGLRVHQGVLDSGCKTTGCTVHFVDNEYDHGPIIDQLAVEVDANDTPESLATRVFEAECELYPQVINELATQQITVREGKILRHSSN